MISSVAYKLMRYRTTPQISCEYFPESTSIPILWVECEPILHQVLFLTIYSIGIPILLLLFFFLSLQVGNGSRFLRSTWIYNHRRAHYIPTFMSKRFLCPQLHAKYDLSAIYQHSSPVLPFPIASSTDRPCKTKLQSRCTFDVIP